MPRKKTADREVDTQAIAAAARAQDELIPRLDIIEKEYRDDQPFVLANSA